MASIVDFFNDVENFSYTEYCATGANAYAVIILLHLGTVVFVLSKVTNDFSWVDRLWSLLPIAFAAHLLYFQVHCDGIQISLRQSIMAAFIFIWGTRLTYNFWRKGGYSNGGEDYRWAWIRKNFGRIETEVLNFFFTSYYQLFLIYWFTSPIYYSSNQELNLFDFVLFLLWIVLFLGETIADNQQFQFQTTKHKMLKQNGNNLSSLPQPYKRGFITDGLWKFSRHPNFFCEFSMWWVIYFLSVSSNGVSNFSGLGALLLNLLFIGSTHLTEIISKEKYPNYRDYIKTVSILLPLKPKSPQQSKKQ